MTDLSRRAFVSGLVLGAPTIAAASANFDLRTIVTNEPLKLGDDGAESRHARRMARTIGGLVGAGIVGILHERFLLRCASEHEHVPLGAAGWSQSMYWNLAGLFTHQHGVLEYHAADGLAKRLATAVEIVPGCSSIWTKPELNAPKVNGSLLAFEQVWTSIFLGKVPSRDSLSTLTLGCSIYYNVGPFNTGLCAQINVRGIACKG